MQTNLTISIYLRLEFASQLKTITETENQNKTLLGDGRLKPTNDTHNFDK